MSNIHGYSERGVVNAVFEAIAARKKGNLKLLRELLQCIVSWDSGEQYDPPDFDHYRVFVEHSLSDFGEPDLVLELRREERPVAVLFIEAKLETYHRSIGPLGNPRRKDIGYTWNASTVLHELFLKWAYVAHLRGLLPVRTDQKPPNVRRVLVYKEDKKKGRWIGKDPVVSVFHHEVLVPFLKDNDPLFVSLTTDAGPSNGPIPSESREEVLNSASRMLVENNHGDPGCKSLFLSNLCLLSWSSILQLAQAWELSRVMRELKRNNSKFKPPLFP